MKKAQELLSVKLTEKFDKELLNILSKELKSLKEPRNRFIGNPKNNSTDDSLLVA